MTPRKQWVWIGAASLLVGATLFGSLFVLPFPTVKASHLDRYGYVYGPLLAIVGFCLLLANGFSGKAKAWVTGIVGSLMILPLLAILAMQHGGDAALFWIVCTAPFALGGIALIVTAVKSST